MIETSVKDFSALKARKNVVAQYKYEEAQAFFANAI